MNAKIQDEVFAFIEDQLRIKLNEIELDRSLNLDLGVDGDDASEFFDAFQKKFQVNLDPLILSWDQYFGSEPTLLSLVAIFKPRRKRKPLFIARIVEAADAGIWTENPSSE